MNRPNGDKTGRHFVKQQISHAHKLSKQGKWFVLLTSANSDDFQVIPNVSKCNMSYKIRHHHQI